MQLNIKFHPISSISFCISAATKFLSHTDRGTHKQAQTFYKNVKCYLEHSKTRKSSQKPDVIKFRNIEESKKKERKPHEINFLFEKMRNISILLIYSAKIMKIFLHEEDSVEFQLSEYL